MLRLRHAGSPVVQIALRSPDSTLPYHSLRVFMQPGRLHEAVLLPPAPAGTAQRHTLRSLNASGSAPNGRNAMSYGMNAAKHRHAVPNRTGQTATNDRSPANLLPIAYGKWDEIKSSTGGTPAPGASMATSAFPVAGLVSRFAGVVGCDSPSCSVISRRRPGEFERGRVAAPLPVRAGVNQLDALFQAVDADPVMTWSFTVGPTQNPS